MQLIICPFEVDFFISEVQIVSVRVYGNVQLVCINLEVYTFFRPVILFCPSRKEMPNLGFSFIKPRNFRNSATVGISFSGSFLGCWYLMIRFIKCFWFDKEAVFISNLPTQPNLNREKNIKEQKVAVTFYKTFQTALLVKFLSSTDVNTSSKLKNIIKFWIQVDNFLKALAIFLASIFRTWALQVSG